MHSILIKLQEITSSTVVSVIRMQLCVCVLWSERKYSVTTTLCTEKGDLDSIVCCLVAFPQLPWNQWMGILAKCEMSMYCTNTMTSSILDDRYVFSSLAQVKQVVEHSFWIRGAWSWFDSLFISKQP
jgi:hypothetical protein